MKPDSRCNETNAAPNDAVLRQAMRDALPAASPDELAALQRRVLAQWEMRTPAHGISQVGPVAVLLHGLRAHRWQWLGAALVIALALGLQAQRMASENAVADLLEPDVLSLIALGEL